MCEFVYVHVRLCGCTQHVTIRPDFFLLVLGIRQIPPPTELSLVPKHSLHLQSYSSLSIYIVIIVKHPFLFFERGCSTRWYFPKASVHCSFFASPFFSSLSCWRYYYHVVNTLALDRIYYWHDFSSSMLFAPSKSLYTYVMDLWWICHWIWIEIVWRSFSFLFNALNDRCFFSFLIRIYDGISQKSLLFSIIYQILMLFHVDGCDDNSTKMIRIKKFAYFFRHLFGINSMKIPFAQDLKQVSQSFELNFIHTWIYMNVVKFVLNSKISRFVHCT